MLGAGIGEGDEVITAPFTSVAAIAAIYYSGARPLHVNIDPQSFTLHPSKETAAITLQTKAIVPVQLYGQIADMDPVREIGRRRKHMVIEDAAWAHDAEYKGRRAKGTWNRTPPDCIIQLGATHPMQRGRVLIGGSDIGRDHWSECRRGDAKLCSLTPRAGGPGSKFSPRRPGALPGIASVDQD